MDMNTIDIEVAPERGRIALAKPLAELRTAYFGEYPYLQTPDRKAALDEMRRLCLDPEVLIVTAHDGKTLVGSIIVAPLNGARYMEWAERNGLNPCRWMHALYTLTQPHYRQQGVNAAMGDLVSAELARRGVEGRIAMVIQRPQDDPKAPAGWRDPVGFFLRRGYEQTDIAPLPASWCDIGDDEPTGKHYIFMALRTGSDA